MKGGGPMKKVTPAKVGIYTVLTFWAVTTLYPFVWVILNSFITDT